ncbi:MAG TPA: dephospho-CoA kinase [Pedobacter sp.]|jgi:dephospho-CoA kinase
MFTVGITGGIGSGKTTVCKIFELQKIPVFYADLEAREIMSSDDQLIAEVKAAFGADIYTSERTLNRSKLARLVFNNDSLLAKLNSLVHPAVFRAFDKWVKRQTALYVIKEAALLFESGSYRDCQATILVKSPHDLKIKRVIERDSIGEADILKRMAKQLSDSEKESLSDYTLQNNEQDLLIPQVLKLHQNFLKLSGSHDIK